ncbi:MAG: hypothetical protein QOH57_4890, partial [Mycobacterium sp.]|nr:hypothetical protein [Mycobacterium sp.]
MAPASLPDRARVVIIGGGVIGTSVAYHLTKLGETDVVLCEQGQLSCGTTWHAAGLVGQLRASESATRLVQYSTQLYGDLEKETGLSAGYKQCGGVTVARTEDRMGQLRRTAANAAAFAMDCELLTPGQALEHWPAMRVDDLVGAIWLPADGKANPTDLTFALARGARMRGARMIEKTRVLGVHTVGGRVVGVHTDAGDVEAEIVVNCAGQWAKHVGAMAGVNVPLHSAEHFYVVSERIKGVHPDLPILRDPDGYTYFKEEVGGLVIGGFEPQAKPWVAPDSIPYPFEFQLLDEDWEHFEILMKSALLRIPALDTTGIKKFYNGPESFTPDNQFILGEAPELANFFVGAGFNSVGIATAGGAGRALAEWIVNGSPTSDLTTVDIRRFASFNGNTRRLRDRVAEVLGLHYEIPWPNREMTTARPFRRSPVHHLLDAANANFGSKMGWERANFFAPADVAPTIEYTWDKPNWLSWSAAEQTNTRSAVTVFDQTSFSKYLMVGPDAEAALQWLCTADVGGQIGKAVYTGMLNGRGTYESDVTVTRTGAE